MAKKQIISTGRWHNHAVNKLIKTLEAKSVWEYILSNPLTSRSGIYTIYSGAISEGIGRKLITAERVREALIELEEVGLIKYEHEQDVLYILDFHKWIPFGNGKPPIIGSELLEAFDESENSLIIKEWWVEYANKNQKS
jgi:hypothetical protein